MSAARLESILASVRQRAAERRARQPLERLRELVVPDSWRRERFLVALEKPGLALIAECKRRAPWSGVLIDEAGRAGTNPVRLPVPGPRWFAHVAACRQGGAALLAVHTEQDHFGCALEDLQTCAHAGLSRLRCDFVLDEGMLLESCLAGADALLLIAALHTGARLVELREQCRELGLAVVLEVRDERELESALALEPELVSVDARDLETHALDPARVERLLARVPAGVRTLARGGLARLEDLRRVRAAGARAALVGEALLRSDDPARLLAGWKAALEA